MATTDVFIEQIIDQALTIGAQKASDASNYAERAITASHGYVSGNPSQVQFTPGDIEPNVYIPSTASGVDQVMFDSTNTKIINDLSGQFAGFFAQYFPNEAGYFQAAQDWVVNALTNGGTGIPAHVEDQIFQRGKARIVNETARASAETLAFFASRRFPIPPGAAQHQIYMQQQEAQNKIAELNRDVVIKQIDVLIENARLAVQMAIDLRTKGIQAASDYMRVLALGPEIALRLSTSAADAQARLIGAASSFYNARIEVEKIKYDVRRFNVGEKNDTMKKELAEFSARLHAQASVLSAAATSAGVQAAAALNAVHAAVQKTAQSDE